LKYLFLVEENSINCGAFRREAVSHCAMPDMLAGDWGWVAEVLAAGRARVLPHAHVFREEGGDNASQSIARIVGRHGLPPWHARFPWLAIPLNVANYLAFDSATGRRKPLPVRLGWWFAVFSVAFARQVMWGVAARLPFRKEIRRFFTRQRNAAAEAR
jgi:hypothetical protein